MDEGVSMRAILDELCTEYSDSKLEALDALLRGDRPTDDQLRASGIDRIDSDTRFKGAVNFLAVYTFRDELVPGMIANKLSREMGALESTTSAFEKKSVNHNWTGGQPMRLGMSREGVCLSARESTRLMENPPTADQARDRELTDRGGFDVLIPAAATLVGDNCIDTIALETFAVRKGDGDRNSREAHKAILALGVCGGLVFDPQSISLSQRVGSDFNDEWRKCGAFTQRKSADRVGVGIREYLADLELTNIPDGEEGNVQAFKPQRARGLCLGLTSRGENLAKNLKRSIDLNTGAILPEVAVCDTPKFDKPGHLTRGECRLEKIVLFLLLRLKLLSAETPITRLANNNNMANPITQSDIIDCLVHFVDDEQHLFFAGVSRGWRSAWGERPPYTRAVTVHTTLPQLRQCFECGQPLEANVCRAIAALGKLTLLQCARASGCPWDADTCSQAAKNGHLKNA
eukprot:g5295.t1